MGGNYTFRLFNPQSNSYGMLNLASKALLGHYPVLERAYPWEESVEAMRHLIEDRPFGRVVLTP
jgi:hypothetical protein